MVNPAPIQNNNRPIYEMVIEDMKERAEHGKDIYGTYLQSFNGRDGLQDLYEELLDACVYIKQILEEKRFYETVGWFPVEDDSPSAKAYYSYWQRRIELSRIRKSEMDAT